MSYSIDINGTHGMTPENTLEWMFDIIIKTQDKEYQARGLSFSEQSEFNMRYSYHYYYGYQEDIAIDDKTETITIDHHDTNWDVLPTYIHEPFMRLFKTIGQNPQIGSISESNTQTPKSARNI
jgi:hypothetical protein